MINLLVRVTDLASDSILDDVKLYKRGDVISVHPDGWNWGSEEKVDPNFRILRWAHESLTTGMTLLSAELSTERHTIPDPMLQVRGYFLDLDSPLISEDMAFYLKDASRSAAAYDVPETITIEMLKTKRDPRKNPNVIG